MNVELQCCGSQDFEAVMPFVRAYHEFEGFTIDEPGRESAVRALLQREELGRLFLVRFDERPIGHVALCFGFSIEFGGRDAFIDELYIEPEFRGRGIGGRVMRLVEQEAAALHVRALHLEVAHDNEKARRLYRAAGFAERDRFGLMSVALGKGAKES